MPQFRITEARATRRQCLYANCGRGAQDGVDFCALHLRIMIRTCRKCGGMYRDATKSPRCFTCRTRPKKAHGK